VAEKLKAMLKRWAEGESAKILNTASFPPCTQISRGKVLTSTVEREVPKRNLSSHRILWW